MLDSQIWANINLKKKQKNKMHEDYRDFQHKKCKVVLIIKTGRDREKMEY